VYIEKFLKKKERNEGEKQTRKGVTEISKTEDGFKDRGGKKEGEK
jgi:hypothetical protein